MTYLTISAGTPFTDGKPRTGGYASIRYINGSKGPDHSSFTADNWDAFVNKLIYHLLDLRNLKRPIIGVVIYLYAGNIQIGLEPPQDTCHMESIILEVKNFINDWYANVAA